MFPGGSPLRRGFSAAWFTLAQKVGDPHQVICQHCSAHQNLESLPAFEQTAFQAPAAKFLPFLEISAALQLFLLRRSLSAPLRYAHLDHTGILTVLHILGAVETPVASVAVPRVLESFLVMFQGSLHMIAIDGISLQHSILGNQTMRTLGQEN